VESDSWTKNPDGTYIRTINKFDKIYDCSILTCTPAYEATSVSCRSFEEFKAKEEEERVATEEKMAEIAQEEAQKRAAEEEEKKKHLEEYYKSLMEEYKDVLERDKEAQE